MSDNSTCYSSDEDFQKSSENVNDRSLTETFLKYFGVSLFNIVKNNHKFIKKHDSKNQGIYLSFYKTPKISIMDYLYRIHKFSKFDNSNIILAYIYIKRLTSKKNFYLSQFNVHRIILISILLALKYNSDIQYTNKYFSLIGGIPLDNINKIEYEFCNFIDFNFYVSENEFDIMKEMFVNNKILLKD